MPCCAQTAHKTADGPAADANQKFQRPVSSPRHKIVIGAAGNLAPPGHVNMGVFFADLMLFLVGIMLGVVPNMFLLLNLLIHDPA